MTQRLARVDPGRTQECLERNKNTEGQGSVHRDVLQERGENWGVQRGWVMRTTRTMTTTTTTTMSRWCWRRKCYFFGTLSDRSKDIRRYSCQNVANEQWTIVQKFGRSFAKGSKTTMKLVAKNHDDRLDEWNFIEGTLVVSKNFFFFFFVEFFESKRDLRRFRNDEISSLSKESYSFIVVMLCMM